MKRAFRSRFLRSGHQLRRAGLILSIKTLKKVITTQNSINLPPLKMVRKKSVTTSLRLSVHLTAAGRHFLEKLD